MPRSGARSIVPVFTSRQPARVAVALLAAVLLLLMLSGIRVQLAGAQATPVADSTTDAPTPQLPVTVTDTNGDEVTVTDISRIVPLNGDLAEIVWALGLGDNVVGVDVSATYPPEATGPLPKIGYQRALSAEGVLSLEPTVIIGSPEAGPLEIIEQIRGAGVPVIIIPEQRQSIDAPAAKIRAVAEALGVAEAGETLAAETQAEIDAAIALGAESATQPRVLFLYVRGEGTQLIAGSETSADAMITAAGGINAGAVAGLVGFQPLTPESLALAAPDTLVLLTAGLESVGGVEGLLEIPGIAQTPAGENQHVLDYDDLYFLGLGPRTGAALAEFVYGLHSDLAPAATPEVSQAA